MTVKIILEKLNRLNFLAAKAFLKNDRHIYGKLLQEIDDLERRLKNVTDKNT